MNPFRRNPAAIALAVLAVGGGVMSVWINQVIATRSAQGFEGEPGEEQIAEMMMITMMNGIVGPVVVVAALSAIAFCLVGAVATSGGRAGGGVGDRQGAGNRRRVGNR